MTNSDKPRCQSVGRYGLPCRYYAKWLTPKTKYHMGGWFVCGVHKHRFETLSAKATAL